MVDRITTISRVPLAGRVDVLESPVRQLVEDPQPQLGVAVAEHRPVLENERSRTEGGSAELIDDLPGHRSARLRELHPSS